MKEHPTKDLVAFGFAAGNYTCKCVMCGTEFTGDKRACRCEPCAESLRALQPTEALTSKQPSNLPQLLREAERRVNEHVWGDRRAIVSIPADVSRDVDILLLTAADQIEAMASVGIRQEREIERLQTDNERLMHHVRASPSLSNAYVKLAETEIDAQRRRANTLQDELRALKSSAHETTAKCAKPDVHHPACNCLDRESRDAARYRFLRHPSNAIVYAKDRHAWGQNASGHVKYDTPAQLDAAIDAAMAGSPEEPECQHDMLKPKTTIVVDPNDPFHASCSACKHDFRMRAPLETSSDGWKCVTCGHENPKGALRCQNAKCTVLSYSPENGK